MSIDTVKQGKRISNEDVEEIRRLWSSTPLSQTDIAKKFGLNTRTVNKIVLRRTHKNKKG